MLGKYVARQFVFMKYLATSAQYSNFSSVGYYPKWLSLVAAIIGLTNRSMDFSDEKSCFDAVSTATTKVVFLAILFKYYFLVWPVVLYCL